MTGRCREVPEPLTGADRELAWLRRVRDCTRLLAAERDLERLLPTVLDAAISLSRAERGFLVRVTGRRPDGAPRIRVQVARGLDAESIRGAQGGVSRRVVQRVVASGAPLVTTSEDQRAALEISSVKARRVLAILCVPLVLRGEVKGALYLDHRFERAPFGAQDLPAMSVLADQAALALELAELQRRPAIGSPALDPETPAEPPPPPTGRQSFGRLLGASPAMQRLYADIERAARTSSIVLIRGESGTGKELVARELHALGGAPQQPLLVEPCADIAETLLESELFGHVRGAFTGAAERRTGVFLQAGGGTLLLDEVGELSLATQARLLRVLQERVVRPLGGEQLHPVRCRIIATTQHDLRARVEAGLFREDLYFRLDVLRVTVPPLRERREDIVPLLEHFLGRAGRSLELSPRARRLLTGYSWPGNVRQLENEAERLASQGLRQLSAQQLSDEVRADEGLAATGPLGGRTIAEVQRTMVELALRECAGNKSRAARQLGIPRSTLGDLLREYRSG